VHKLISAVSLHLPKTLNRIGWCEHVYCTDNFIRTVKSSVLSEYLRPLDALLVWGTKPPHRVLLVSEREADRILGLLWKCTCVPKFTFVNQCFLREACDRKARNDISEPQLQIGHLSSVKNHLCSMQDISMASLQLLQGEAMYATDGRKSALKKMLQHDAAKSVVVDLLQMRGLSHMMAFSDLEKARGIHDIVGDVAAARP